ncbi:UDP-glucose:Glyco protein glucosyltransferase-domain-containing protein [Dimargaris cristalligena]|uniref:UDP-glucose:Glyco protein glucosyltransferase-domain-containing protein n=1 Tax=Dimargaris cristalligena TaxID=215637 RepID=A0A4P9ZS80_9FUNG|nr:UDP-glucose:Glyco protein glucosyltransferase-domain-containing protein [Dimargaris cristalligena]|eukprot:RKP36048.1 UDP-glucose:Glyco protein glucosyltransferase-domain-containing protein [Dimargaris cristalligena]
MGRFPYRRLLCWALAPLGLAHAQSPPVQVSLTAQFPAPPLALEIAEYISTENRTAYLPLLDHLVATPTAPPQVIYERALAFIHQEHMLPGAPAQALLEWAMALHIAAPAVQTFYQYYTGTVVPEMHRAESEFDPNCPVWVWYNLRQYCSWGSLRQALGGPASVAPPRLPFDHLDSSHSARSGGTSAGPTFIFYADITDPDFVFFFRQARHLARAVTGTLIFRPRPPRAAGLSAPAPLDLTGYGVSLTLKSTEYKVIDDSQLATDVPLVRALSPSEIKDLGLIAAQYIINQSQSTVDPLRALTLVAQNFPKYAAQLASQTYSPALAQEARALIMKRLNPGIWLNGLPLKHSTLRPLDSFGLVQSLRAEAQTIEFLLRLPLTPCQARQLLGSSFLDPKQGRTAVPIYDVREDPLSPAPALVWYNDVERDPAYAAWSKLEYFRNSLYSNGLRPMSKNLCSILFVVDLASHRGLEILVDDIAVSLRQRLPLRFGILPLIPANPEATTPSAVMARLFYHLMATLTRDEVSQYFAQVLRLKRLHPQQDITTVAREVFDEQFPSATVDFATITGSEGPYRASMDSATTLLARLGVNPADSGALFVNGKYFELAEGYRTHVMEVYQSDSMLLAQAYFQGQIDNDTDLYEYLLTQPGALTERNPYIIPSPARPLTVYNVFAAGVESTSGDWIHRLGYFYPFTLTDTTSLPIVSIWVVGDLKAPASRQDLQASLQLCLRDPTVRVAWLPSPVATDALDASPLARLVGAVQRLAQDLYNAKVFSQELEASNQAIAPFAPYLYHALSFALEHSDINDTTRTLVVNGRRLPDLPDSLPLTATALQLLVSYEIKTRIQPIANALDILDGEILAGPASFNDLSAIADKILAAGSIVHSCVTPAATYPTSELPIYRQDLQSMLSNLNQLKFTRGDLKQAWFHIQVIVDPLSEEAQKWGAILETVTSLPRVAVEVYLRPDLSLDELPLKQFYRYLAPAALQFDPEDGQVYPPSLTFNGLPTQPLFTLAIDAPSAWMVTPVACAYDLDNIQLATVPSAQASEGIRAHFQLKHIMVEGHCQDLTLGYPPRGLQLVLGNPAQPHVADTIVMANYGYVQFLADPGVWTLRLRDGRSSDIYVLEDIASDGWSGDALRDVQAQIIVNSFQGAKVYPRVRRRPGQEAAQLLQTTEETANPSPPGYFGSTSGLLRTLQDWVGQAAHRIHIPFLGSSSSGVGPLRTIHVFSVASGHLYERFMAIMIVSVLRHTEHPVKFWFIENFLSPSFKQFLPTLAAHYQFTYQLVTYQWPYWLRPQKEKQRTIWGYKILFLDVLFPLDLDRVIFVDADQIVRVDLAELANIDLQGAPYGYTPFCDNRPEMDKFRFWKGGWWAQHLGHKPYHISALYVVDLRRFRQLAAGDRLRQQYQLLSQDPNSLANLDQDLPNNMQHEVPIFSLPQDWLWCETWCSDESLGTAKTIDLCNNPLTKEPKLKRAVRLLPEWEVYDSEIRQLREPLPDSTPTPSVSTVSPTHDEL